MRYTVAAFYRFTPLQDLPGLREELLARFAALPSLCGTLLLAEEGINGTMAGDAAAIEAMLALLADKAGLPRADVKFSYADDKPFNRLKIKLKQEIISFRQPAADPNVRAGTYVAPQDWNALLDDPEVLVLDTRNKYETMVGTFAGAEDPQIDTFTEFADYVRAKLDPARHKKVAMFCTGGICCEKASAYMLAQGFEDVYHLKGGILAYLETVSADSSQWQGACYVFDRRVAVGHGLVPQELAACYCCNYPLRDADLLHPDYEPGVSCRHCGPRTSAADKARYRMRHRQIAAQAAQSDEAA